MVVAILGFLFVAGGPLYILYEGKQAVITQFGRPIGGPVTEAGLHFKVPFIQKVNYFEKKILEWDGYANQIPTKDKKYILLDTTARWRINDPLKFFQSVYDERGAQGRLDDIIDSAARDAITAHNLIEIVRSSNRIVTELEALQEEKEFIEEGALESVKVGREKIREEILMTAQELAPQYGIELIDVRVKRVNINAHNDHISHLLLYFRSTTSGAINWGVPIIFRSVIYVSLLSSRANPKSIT